MTEREKIIEIIRQSGYGYFVTHDNADTEQALQDTAKALIENGIGDISEWKESNKILKKALTSMAEDYCKDTNKKTFVVGNKTHYLSSAYTDSELCSVYLKQAEKEIEEEGKR